MSPAGRDILLICFPSRNGSCSVSRWSSPSCETVRTESGLRKKTDNEDDPAGKDDHHRFASRLLENAFFSTECSTV